MPKINCAIYTRKSTEEGLEQDFNSLDNQYESARAYIESQKHEGWGFYKRYDDGGYTGANIKRPGLTELLEDINKGYVQCVVVYKVDRLSRSLSDFTKMMELFEKYQVGFVSITQHFNTSNSMGKLTLNVLLSFAQFEREVTAERVRDKVAASRKKGMWMGGNIPYGYKLEDKKLLINPKQAKDIKYFFSSYLSTSSIIELKNKLNSEGYRTNRGKLWGHGALGLILSNPTYIGKVKHKKNIYDGMQGAIIEEPIWEQVQEKLEKQNNRNTDSLEVGRYLLFKKLYDTDGEMFRCDACIKNNKRNKVRYEYYISNNRRFRTNKIEDLVIENIKSFTEINNVLDREELDELSKIAWDKLIFEKRKELVKYLIDKVILDGDQIRIEIERERIKHLQAWQTQKSIKTEMKSLDNVYISSDTKTINIIDSFESLKVKTRFINNSLLWNIAKGYQYKQWMEAGDSILTISAKENKQNSFIIRITRLAYLSPKIIESVIKGDYREGLTVAALERASCHDDWSKQEEIISEYLFL